MRFEDYYARLGVARDASAEDIRKAYRKLARKYHPDVSKEPDAEARIKEINEAWAVLGDPEKRTAYDQLGSNWRAGEEFRPPPEWQGGGFGAEFSSADFGDLFESLFRHHGGGPRGGQRGGPRRRPARAGDQVARVEITVEEAVNGCERQLRVSGPDGARTLKVKVPAGATEGFRMRLGGQATGGPGEAPGDVFLEVHLRPHPLYRVDGRNLAYDLPLAPWEAALGTRLDVPTPTGPVGLSIPAGTQGGQRLRLKGRGLPAMRSGEAPGDLILEIKLRNPEASSEAARLAFERLRDAAPFDARAGWGGAAVRS